MRYEIGTMIEIPRAALTADAIATEADFFSFGTNDLTVFYTIQGTASNGVDYVALPGSVTIPAGSLYVDIPVDILGDAVAEPQEAFTGTITMSGSQNSQR